MRSFTRFLDRLLPALLIAASVTLLTAGLLSYTSPAFGDVQTEDPLLIGENPLFESAAPGESPAPTDLPTAIPPASATPGVSSPSPTPFDPFASPGPTFPGVIPGTTPGPAATAPPLPPSSGAAASRIRISSFGIDLPVVPSDLVVPGNRNFYPLCDVAMAMQGFVAPGDPGSSYIYAHAQRGMFWPLLAASRRGDDASMLGALVELYTADNKLHLYEIYRIKRHATDLSLAHNVPEGQHILVLQTSEGTSGHIPKLQLAARPLSVVDASPSEANPRPRPRVCLPH